MSGPNGGLVARQYRTVRIADYPIRVDQYEEIARHPPSYSKTWQRLIAVDFPISFFVGRHTSRRATAARNFLSNTVAKHGSKKGAKDQGKQHIHDATRRLPITRAVLERFHVALFPI
jgi:hypothetical protein